MRIKTVPETSLRDRLGYTSSQGTALEKGFRLAEQSCFYCGRFWIFPGGPAWPCGHLGSHCHAGAARVGRRHYQIQILRHL
jgi:hypothetical protein